jgi:hypothetical protein
MRARHGEIRRQGGRGQIVQTGFRLIDGEGFTFVDWRWGGGDSAVTGAFTLTLTIVIAAYRGRGWLQWRHWM